MLEAKAATGTFSLSVQRPVSWLHLVLGTKQETTVGMEGSGCNAGLSTFGCWEPPLQPGIGLDVFLSDVPLK